jgi:hypothetical protein
MEDGVVVVDVVEKSLRMAQDLSLPERFFLAEIKGEEEVRKILNAVHCCSVSNLV